MFSRGTTYRKSGKGAEAIASRLHGLPPRLRSLLIVVDGKKDGQDLLKFAANLGDANAMVADLIEGGFIEPVPGTETLVANAPEAGSTPPQTAVTAAPAAAPTGIPLPQAKRLAVRLLVDLMGPMADDACIGIESAKNPEQFMSAVKKAHGLVQAFRGEDAASKFRDDVGAVLS